MIKLYKDCIVLEHADKSRDYDVVDSLTHYLGEVIEFAEEITFGELMSHLRQDIEFYEKVFHVQLGGFSIQPFLDDMDQVPLRTKTNPTIEYIEIYRVAEHWDYGKYGKAFEYWTDFHGVNTDGSVDGYKPGETCGVSLSFSPLCELRDYPVRLDKELEIRDYSKDSDGKRSLKAEDLVAIKTETCYTVYDVFGAILDDITFYGYPENRDEKLEDLTGQVEELKEMKENDPEEYNRQVRPWEELRDELKKRQEDDDEESDS